MLKAYLLGQFRIERDNCPLEGLEGHKVQEFFGYLLLHRQNRLSREKISCLLWPEATLAQSKKNLRQILWQIQSAFHPQHELIHQQILRVEPDWVQLSSDIDLWVDVALLEQAFELTQAIPGRQLDASNIQVLRNATQLYQGPLLEGCYDDWCLQERERLQMIYLTLLDKLMDSCEVLRRYEEGLQYGMRILCYDRTRERTHRRLMLLYYLAGDRATALQQYERCARALYEELEVKPSKKTTALYQQIVTDQLEDAYLAAREAKAVAAVSSHQLSTILTHLSQLQTTLYELQGEVNTSIKAVEKVLIAYN